MSDDALIRHDEKHVPEALRKAHGAQEAARADALLADLDAIRQRVQLLFDACDRWLRDPDAPDRYELGPRAEDVRVTYWHTANGGRRVRRKHRLSTLLARVAREAPDVELVETKHADPRELVLKTADRLQAQLELLAKLTGQLRESPAVSILITAEWRTIQTNIAAALAPYPDARLAVARALTALPLPPTEGMHGRN